VLIPMLAEQMPRNEDRPTPDTLCPRRMTVRPVIAILTMGRVSYRPG